MLNNKRIIIATGGTGGHINPALAVAGYIKEKYPLSELLFIGTADNMEARLVPAAGYDFRTIDIQGFRRGFSPQKTAYNIRTLAKIVSSRHRASQIMREFKPDAVIGFGGYVSGPVLSAAVSMGIPTAVHEQNAFPGVTNKTLARRVDKVMLTVPDAEKYIRSRNPCTVTGLPVRGEMIRADREFSRAQLKLDDRPLILSMGGSLGAKVINEAVTQLICERYQRRDCYFLHATGESGVGMIDLIQNEKKIDLNENKHIMLREYIDDMDVCMSAADLVICRAGASTLSELEALGKPSILIPYPYAAENHQYYNAMALVNNSAAIMFEEKDFTGDKLIETVDGLLEDRARLASIGKNARSLAVLNASERIADCICEIVK